MTIKNLRSRVLGFAAVLCITLLFPALAACRPSYSAKSITARVVDAQTKEPIEGVVVVAHWQLQGGLEGGYGQGELMVLEALTDQSGTFHFPAWGPKRVPSGRAWNARLKELDPQILFFKSGYLFDGLQNLDHTDAQEAASVRTSEYDGKTIELHKFAGTLMDYARSLSSGEGLFLNPLFTYCGWKQVPRMLSALGQQEKAFVAQGVQVGNSYNSLVASEEQEAKAGCGSVRAFLQGNAP